ncbi:hypothetical protein [Virgibacillus doumboii]|uniref:hypothetical protein n=1 Tax=Virgibacillus doumboii TaxID=2697503 RepID=UPI0013DEF9E9|nr:hypothetical protein [Virgibacillus doumboii]
MILYHEFINIAKTLNKELDIVPVLYGSLGVEKVTGIDFSPQDIDILVPLTFLEEKWRFLKMVMEKLGYEFTDVHEHEFRKNKINIGIAYIEDLKPFAGVNYKDLAIVEEHGARYYALSISDYLKIYNRSLLDGYRRTKNNNKDQRKLDVLNHFVEK